jgi:HAD superfamily hydrolase (TIGR01490 family)
MSTALEMSAMGHERQTGRVAVFDLDRTLIPGSSLVPFGRAALRRGLARRRDLLRNGLAALAFQRRGLAEGGIDRVEERILAVIAGRSRDELAEVAHHVGGELANLVYPSARWLLDRHVAAGDFCIILTASPQELAEAVAAELGAHRAIGTRLATEDGRLTGSLDGVRCHGPGKLARLRDEVGAVDWSKVTAYGDSGSDLPVLESAAWPVAVNPDRGLRVAAAARGWPVLRFG